MVDGGDPAAHQARLVEFPKKPPGTVYYTETADSRNLSFHRNHIEPVTIKPAVEDQFRGIVRQAYDYSC
ncbi:hypothetical protein ABTJ02_19845, partial [Acinetobacter baumannii]